MTVEELKVEIEELKKSEKSKEELAMEILRSDDKELDSVFWVRTTESEISKKEKFYPSLNGPISKREIFLSVLIGTPYPTYFLDGVMDYRRETYRNEITEPRELQADAEIFYSKRIEERKEKSKDASDEKGAVKFGLKNNGINYGIEEMPGELEVSEKELLAAGLDPEKFGFEPAKTTEHKKLALKDLIESIKEHGLTRPYKETISKLFGKDGQDKGDRG